MGKKNDELCKFVLENYEDLEAATEVFDLGKERLLELVKREVFEALVEDLKDKGFEVDIDGEEIWWYPSDSGKLWWNKEKRTGLYFTLVIEPEYSESIVQPTEDEVYLALYHTDKSSVEKGKATKLRNHILHEKSTIKKEGILINDEGSNLVRYVPSIELNLTAIRDDSRFPVDIVKKAIKFTETLLPIVQKYKTE